MKSIATRSIFRVIRCHELPNLGSYSRSYILLFSFVPNLFALAELELPGTDSPAVEVCEKFLNIRGSFGHACNNSNIGILFVLLLLLLLQLLLPMLLMRW